MKRTTLPALAAVVFLGACQGPPIADSAQQGIAAGTGLGAVTGALLGSLSGDFGWGALIGAAAGATGGYLYERGQQG